MMIMVTRIDIKNIKDLNTILVDRKFGRPEDYIEVFITDLNDTILSTIPNFTEYTSGENTQGLVDEIKNLGVPIHTYIRGYAASASTLLSVVGSQRYMYNYSVLMIHSVKLHNQEPSTLLDVKDLNTNVDVFMDIIRNIYLENSNLNNEILDELFNHDIWLNSKTALKYGLIDEII